MDTAAHATVVWLCWPWRDRDAIDSPPRRVWCVRRATSVFALSAVEDLGTGAFRLGLFELTRPCGLRDGGCEEIFVEATEGLGLGLFQVVIVAVRGRDVVFSWIVLRPAAKETLLAPELKGTRGADIPGEIGLAEGEEERLHG